MTDLSSSSRLAPRASSTATQYHRVHLELRQAFEAGTLKSFAARRRVLKALRKSIQDHEERLFHALKKDFNKPKFETYTSEIGFCYQEIDHTLAELKEWMRPRTIPVGLALFPSKAKSYQFPKGVVLIIAPWNYPVNLSLAPLIAALAAGCHVVLKPAEDTPTTSTVIVSICRDAFRASEVCAIEGPGAEVVPALMEAGRFDHVFYTGSTKVGRSLGKQCGEALISCTLELGGKSPALIMADANLKVAAERITWGKFLNAGQTCVAPDYLLVEAKVFGDFLQEMKASILRFYGADPQSSPDYARIINDKHFQRLKGLLEATTIEYGGDSDASDRYIAPTLLSGVSTESLLMHEEIFGPLLPMIPVESFAEAKQIIAQNPNPLAAYCFTADKVISSRFIEEISFGGGCINDTVIHLGVAGLPFGGVQQSGLGRYHAEEGFKAFSNQKSILTTSTWPHFRARFAPYSKILLKTVKRLLG